MMSKRIATVSVAFALALTPASRVAADGGDFAAGILAGVVGSAVVRDIQKKNQAKKQQQVSRKSYSNNSVSSAQREENTQVQTALNYFGFPVGTPDGSIGPRSRAAIGQYQGLLGYPTTGQLTDYEKDFLLNSYYRAQAGGAVTAQAVAANPQGVQGLLIGYRNELAAGATVQPQVMPEPLVVPDGGAQGQMAKQPDASAPPATQLVVDPAANVQQPAVQAAVQPAPGAAVMPSFLGQDGATASLAGQCDSVSGQATVTDAAAAGDPLRALSEQFCAARGLAIAESDKLAAQVPGFTAQQIADQCAGFGPLLKDYVTALGQQPQAEVMERVSGFALSSGMKPAQLSGTARTCLGLGYKADDMNVALGSAMVLTALGETGYAELVGYQLSQGFGVPARPDLAVDWYDAALAAPVPVFAAAGADRMAVIKAAVDQMAGRATQGAAQAVPEVVPAKMPSFGTGGADVAADPAAPATGAGAAPTMVPKTVSP
ncbi:MAG: peptidoglycan-binding protein [Cereibacter sphaeroides]|uniref:Peptidoglycan-binding protein n=1 Tax=Cereibacter sphaeroides TaxID=1063 RepID=A0A2W5S7H8_CERSP|nr:MAG: peptidoglycan-binding protein [Cereibacter sphaeroides]